MFPFHYFRSNVLVDSHFNAKIGDFGFTQEMPCIDPDSGVTLKTAKCVVKSLGYTAPEIDACRHSVKTDVYSYGVVCASYIVIYIIGTDLVIFRLYWRRTQTADRTTKKGKIHCWYA